MRISDTEIKKILDGPAVADPSFPVDGLAALGHDPRRDDELVYEVTQSVMAMGDREEAIASLRARIEAGTYAPTAEQIVDGMARRAIADQVS